MMILRPLTYPRWTIKNMGAFLVGLNAETAVRGQSGLLNITIILGFILGNHGVGDPSDPLNHSCTHQEAHLGHWLVSGWIWEEETPLSSVLGQKAFLSLLVQLFFFFFSHGSSLLVPLLFFQEKQRFSLQILPFLSRWRRKKSNGVSSGGCEIHTHYKASPWPPEFICMGATGRPVFSNC